MYDMRLLRRQSGDEMRNESWFDGSIFTTASTTRLSKPSALVESRGRFGKACFNFVDELANSLVGGSDNKDSLDTKEFIENCILQIIDIAASEVAISRRVERIVW